MQVNALMLKILNLADTLSWKDIWAATSQNQQNDCTPSEDSAQSDQSLRCPHEESLGP